MNDEPPRPRPLTPLEESKLRNLLTRAEASLNYEANSAEAKRLQAEQKKLAEREAKAVAKLADIQAALDRVTSKLTAILARRQDEYRYGCGPSSLPALRYLNRSVSQLKEKLAAEPVPEHLTPDDLALFLECAARSNFPEFYTEDQPTPAERIALAEAELEQRRAETASAILNAGRARRNEPPLPEGVVRFPNKLKE